MTKKDQNLIKELIDKEKWNDILERFIDVLKVNIFLIDAEGQAILSSVMDRYGWGYFSKTCLGWRASGKASILTKFTQAGSYLEYRCQSGLQSFAIPIYVEDGRALAYLMVGPVILNRRQVASHYCEVAKEMKIDLQDLMDALNDVRVVSHITMKSILDLLAEVAKDVTELNLERKRLSKMRINREALPRQITEAAQDIYTRIHLDELLVTLLDIALKITSAECGSIMILDSETGELTIKASRGMGEKIQNTRLRIGEGIAGLAAKESASFVIHGTQGENRIKHLLKRPEIKHAVVMPLVLQSRVFGVLNLHTKNEETDIEDSLGNLQYLSKLISAAFQSI